MRQPHQFFLAPYQLRETLHHEIAEAHPQRYLLPHIQKLVRAFAQILQIIGEAAGIAAVGGHRQMVANRAVVLHKQSGFLRTQAAAPFFQLLQILLERAPERLMLFFKKQLPHAASFRCSPA